MFGFCLGLALHCTARSAMKLLQIKALLEHGTLVQCWCSPRIEHCNRTTQTDPLASGSAAIVRADDIGLLLFSAWSVRVRVIPGATTRWPIAERGAIGAESGGNTG
jgi:hypothetical protein